MSHAAKPNSRRRNLAKPGPLAGVLRRLVMAALALACLWLVAQLHGAGQPIWALALLILCGAGFYVAMNARAMAFRYLFPGLAGMAVFIVFPLVYMVGLGFSNYSSSHLLSQARVAAYLLDQSLVESGRAMAFSLHADGSSIRIVLSPPHEVDDEADPALRATLEAAGWVTPPLAGRRAAAEPLTLQALTSSGFKPGAALPLADVIARRDQLRMIQIKGPDGTLLQYAGLREFGPLKPLWTANPDGSLTRSANQRVYSPNPVSGYFESAAGDRISPGFKVNVGLANYARILGDAEFRSPFFSIFLWTLSFAALTVLFSATLGIGLAVLLNWEALRYRTFYRTLLFLPYAVPGFISILVFKGLFNQNFGEINAILNALLGIKPAWFTEPWLARAMLLIVNTWLGYPYFMILCSGLIKAIPADLYEASAIAGAKPLDNFRLITAPLIVRPLTPLLISAFAFNFNNFVLISLLTDGRPDFLNTQLPAGTTDILVSYTYRIAFQDAGQNFGLAAAISTLIFAMVALMSLLNLKLARVHPEKS
jgi:maltose/maltodextrin transport system permease protein